MQGPGKKWEHYDLNKNGKPLRIPMHVRRGDTVQVIAGKDKGKVGEVTLVRSSLPAVGIDKNGLAVSRLCFIAGTKSNTLIRHSAGLICCFL